MADINIAGFGLGGGDDDSNEGSKSSSKEEKYSGPIDEDLARHRSTKVQKAVFFFVVIFLIHSIFTQMSTGGEPEATPKSPKQVGPQKVVPLWYNG